MPHVLRNPHSVLAAIETRPADVLEIILPSKGLTDSWSRVAKLARENGIRVTNSNPRGSRPSRGMPARDSASGSFQDESSRMGLAEAIVKERTPIPPELLFENASKRAEGKGLWLALDSLQDPHNIGAIFRAAAFFGVQGILLTQERSAPLSSVAYDVASGGIEHVPFSIQVNLQRSFEVAKEAGLWILGTSEHANDDLTSISRDRPWLLVLGNEEKGMRRLTEESCDLLCKVSGAGAKAGKVTSLNVSVAAGIMVSYLSKEGF